MGKGGLAGMMLSEIEARAIDYALRTVFGFGYAEAFIKCRRKELVTARQFVFRFLNIKYFEWEIAEFTGWHRTTIIHHLIAFNDLCYVDKDYRKQYEEFASLADVETKKISLAYTTRDGVIHTERFDYIETMLARYSELLNWGECPIIFRPGYDKEDTEH